VGHVRRGNPEAVSKRGKEVRRIQNSKGKIKKPELHASGICSPSLGGDDDGGNDAFDFVSFLQ